MKVIKIILLLFCFIVPAYASEKLLFSLDLIRHGDRAPIEPLPNVPYTGKTPLGHLTPEGMAQTYVLGTKFREKYVHQTQLLPEQYEPHLMYVRSSDFDRTLVSAQCLLMGLYPLGTGPKLKGEKQFALPKGYVPIPIHTIAKANDALVPCETQPEKKRALKKKYIQQEPLWRERESVWAEDMKAWEKTTGFHFESLYSVGRFADILMIYQSQEIPLPDWLSPQQIAQIQHLHDWIYLSLSKNYSLASSLGYPLVKTITDYLQKAHDDKTPLKYVLLSGHDISILATAGALGAILEHPPGYAAVLNFSLIEDEKKNRWIAVYYDGKPLPLPGCQGHQCDMSQFQTLIKAAKDSADPELSCHV